MNALIKTNSKQYRERIYAELLERINFEDDNGKYIEDLTPRQKIEYLLATYKSEYDNSYNRKQYPNNQERLAQWLMGIPSNIDLPIYNSNILEFAAKVHGIESVPKDKENVIINNWFNHIAFILIQMNSKIK